MRRAFWISTAVKYARRKGQEKDIENLIGSDGQRPLLPRGFGCCAGPWNLRVRS
jgi:hypothetical protein